MKTKKLTKEQEGKILWEMFIDSYLEKYKKPETARISLQELMNNWYKEYINEKT